MIARGAARAAGLLALAALACNRVPPAQLLVAVCSDLPAAPPLEHLTVELHPAQGGAPSRLEFPLGRAPLLPGRFALPLSFGVVPAGGDVARAVRVVARATWTADGVPHRVEAVAVTGFREDAQLLLPMRLQGRCVDHACGADETCVDDGLRAACAPAARPPTALRALTPESLAAPPACDPPPDAGAPPPPPPRVVQLNVSRQATFAVMSDGTLRAAGFGVGSYEGVVTSHRNTFVPIPGMTGLVEAFGACGRRADGSVWCKVADNAPRRVADLDDAVQLRGLCALRRGGAVSCWGAPETTSDLRAAPVPGLTDALEVAGTQGIGPSCAVRPDGGVWCWGNVGLQLSAAAPPASMVVAAPVRIPGVADAVSVAVGNVHGCAVIRDGTLRCWGRRALVLADTNGATYNTNVGAVTIADVSDAPLTRVRSVVAGWGSTWALRDDGTVVAWGINASGAFSNDALTESDVAVTVPGLAGVRALATGISSDHMCALLEDASVRCWGADEYGQLGHGGGVVMTPRTVVAGGGGAAPLRGVLEDAGSDAIHCTRHADGVRCWGSNERRHLDVAGAAGRFSPFPLLVPGLTDVASLRTDASAGPSSYGAFCVALADGTARCWGGDDNGTGGDGTTTARAAPTPVLGLSGVTRVGGGAAHSCAIVAGGELRCWGNNRQGQVGDGTTNLALRPVAVTALRDVVEVGGAGDTTVARTRDGRIYVWGARAPLLGNLAASPLPVALDGMVEATQLSFSLGAVLCALRPTGRVSCRGPGYAGGWNDMGLAEVTQLSGGTVTCARLADGTLRCWGDNQFGCIGNPTLRHDATYTTPQVVVDADGAPLRNVRSVRAAPRHTCARMADDTLRCWGSNINGLIGTGDGHIVQRLVSPVGL